MKHETRVIPVSSAAGRAWRALCSCGWQSPEYRLSILNARNMGERHVFEQTKPPDDA